MNAQPTGTLADMLLAALPVVEVSAAAASTALAERVCNSNNNVERNVVAAETAAAVEEGMQYW